jgi:hypothetical protein
MLVAISMAGLLALMTQTSPQAGGMFQLDFMQADTGKVPGQVKIHQGEASKQQR